MANIIKLGYETMVEEIKENREFVVNFNEMKKYIKNENGPVVSYVYTNIDEVSHENIKKIIIDNPKILTINGGEPINVQNILVVFSNIANGKEILNLEINEPLNIAQTLI